MQLLHSFDAAFALLLDVAPSPGRPAWDHTPLPQPELLLVVSVVVLGLAGLALVKRRQVSAT